VRRFLSNYFDHLFSLIFLFVPRGGLRWLYVSFILHVKYTISYRIVNYFDLLLIVTTV